MAASFTGLGIAPSVYLAIHFPRFADYPYMPVLTYLGIVLDVGSLWLFWRTHSDLGKNWSVSLDLRERHTLVTTGVYGVVRHPMYAGALIYLLGTPLALGSYWGLAVLAVMTPILIWRLVDEERVLDERLPGYSDYKRKVQYRLLPGVY